MQNFLPAFSDDRPARLLLLGAHSDDIEIGCGGSILRLIAERPSEVCWVVFSASGDRAREATGSAREFLEGCVRAEVRTLEFPDAYFPSCSADIKRAFESLKS